MLIGQVTAALHWLGSSVERSKLHAVISKQDEDATATHLAAYRETWLWLFHLLKKLFSFKVAGKLCFSYFLLSLWQQFAINSLPDQTWTDTDSIGLLLCYPLPA